MSVAKRVCPPTARSLPIDPLEDFGTSRFKGNSCYITRSNALEKGESLLIADETDRLAKVVKRGMGLVDRSGASL